MAFFDLLDGVSIVIPERLLVQMCRINTNGHVRCDGDISTIDDGGPAVEGISVEWDIVAAAESHFA